MKQPMLTLCALFVLCCLAAGDQTFRKGEMLIQIKNGQEIKTQGGTIFGIPGLDALGEKWGLIAWRRLIPRYDEKYPSISQMCLIALPEDADIEAVCRDYRENIDVEAASPNNYIQPTGVPNDVHWNLQWNLFTNRTNMPGAWELAYHTLPSHGYLNGNSVILAILDVGVDTGHVDLRGSLWLNEGEIPDDGEDNDGNGYIDDVKGWNFGDGNNLVFNSDDDQAYHGTGCAGIAAAKTNNNTGIAGVSGGWDQSIPGTTIMPVRMWNMRNNTNALGNAISSLYYASVNGAKVLSCSWEVNAIDYVLLQNAINDVYNN